jgi:hypothetical protein
MMLRSTGMPVMCRLMLFGCVTFTSAGGVELPVGMPVESRAPLQVVAAMPFRTMVGLVMMMVSSWVVVDALAMRRYG